MPITDKDKEFMDQVAAYFRSTKTSSEPVGSIRDTAIKFNINRNKVRKILITTGDLKSPITAEAVRMRNDGMSIKEIAKELGVSVATVSTAMPYEDKINNTLDPTEHATQVREYRAYERNQIKRQAGMDKKRMKESFIPELKEEKSEQNQVLRLHMESYDEYSNDIIDAADTEIFRKYGKVEYGKSISRDVIVPADIPLYALHYVIQRAFGWQNSHLHQFYLPDERFKMITNDNAFMWSCMVGLLFRSPLMDNEDEFWADDYNGGSFKNWLRTKYTGPYLSQCHGEGIISCKEDMMQLDMKAEYYVLYLTSYNKKTKKYDGEEILCEVSPVLDYKGNKLPKPKPLLYKKIPYRVEKVKFENVPVEGLKFIFERNPYALLERLPLNSVLAPGELAFPENCSEEEKNVNKEMVCSGDELISYMEKNIKKIFEDYIDSPYIQVNPLPVTDVLLYDYDFGDNWKIKITASRDSTDLVQAGRITKGQLDRANAKCREMYRPVLIAKDGEMLIDDVGGIHGFADFLQKINPELKGKSEEQKKEAKQEKMHLLSWAKGLGWHREKLTDFNLL